MSTEVVSPLRQRMIEDMNARKLGAHSQRGHIYSCRRLAAFLKRSPDTATPDDIRRFQLHLAETGMSICNRNRIMTGVKFLFRVTLRRLDLAADEPGRDQTPAGRCQQSQGSHSPGPRLWLRPTCQRGGAVEGQAYRQRPEDHSCRAGRPQP